MENIKQVTDPEVHREPSPDMTGYSDDQDIEKVQVKAGLEVADDEIRDREELDRDERERREELDSES